MRNLAQLAFLTVAMIAMSVPSARAQHRQGQNDALRDVQGVVTDNSGKPVAGAVVQLKNTKSLQIISFITKDQGDYYFHGLNPDIDFELTAEHGNKISSTRTLSSFDSRKQAILDLKLDKEKKP